LKEPRKFIGWAKIRTTTFFVKTRVQKTKKNERLIGTIPIDPRK